MQCGRVLLLLLRLEPAVMPTGGLDPTVMPTEEEGKQFDGALVWDALRCCVCVACCMFGLLFQPSGMSLLLVDYVCV